MKILYKRTDGGFEFMEQIEDRRVKTIAGHTLKKIAEVIKHERHRPGNPRRD